MFWVIRHSFSCSVRNFFVCGIDLLSRMSSSLLCIYLKRFSLPYSGKKRLIDLQRPFFDVNGDAFERYNFFKSRWPPYFIPKLYSLIKIPKQTKIKRVRLKSFFRYFKVEPSLKPTFVTSVVGWRLRLPVSQQWVWIAVFGYRWWKVSYVK